jgi:type II pantothenate kinase
MIIGIDIGSTTTKAVSISDGSKIQKIKTRATDAITSATGAFGKMLMENDYLIGDIDRIMITGTGSSKIKNDIFGIPTERVDEMQCIGIGGMFLSGKDDIVIANIGTGTAFIDASRDRISHIGGSGVGGGTIQGLAKKLISMTDFNGIMELADMGNLSQVDLNMEDITDAGLSFLGRDTTASNFGKMLDTARNEDLALGLLNMVYQVIGMLAVFAARSKRTNRVIVTGNGSHNAIGQKILSAITEMYSVHFEYPEDAEYTTAIGAGLSYRRGTR